MNQDYQGHNRPLDVTRVIEVDPDPRNRGYELHSKSLGHLFTQNDGWSLDQVIDWLFNVGQLILQPTRFADELARILAESGVPIIRLRFAFRTLHPQVAACTFTWTQGKNSTEFCVLHKDSSGDTLADPELEQLLTKNGMDGISLQLASSTGECNIMNVVTKSSNGLSTGDITKFNVLAVLLSPVIELLATRRITTTLLDTYIGHRAGQRVLDGLIMRGDGETIDAVIWYSDLRDFTLLTETLAPDALLSMLNTYFEYVSTAVSQRGGEVLRFIGDAMLIVFPVEKNADVSQTCRSALDAANDTLLSLDALNRQRQQAGAPPIRFGIGLHIGQVIYGNVGAPNRLDFTVMGAAVNRTARLEELTKKVGVPLLLSAEIAAHAEGGVRSMGKYSMRGVAEQQEVFTFLAD